MRNLYMPKKLRVSAVLLSLLTLSGCVSAPIVLAGAGGTAAAGSAGSSVSMPQQVDDLTIRSKIYNILNNTPNINGANVEVTVFNGIVLLLGQIGSNDLMQQVVTKTSAIPGVVVVYNQMIVGPNEPLSQYTSDSWITSKVIASITKKVNPLHFKVVTQNSVVYLLGQVTHNEANLAVNQAGQVTGVKSIVKIFNYVNPTTAEPEVVPINNSVAAANNASSTASTSASAPSTAPAAAQPSVAAPTPSASNDNIPEYAPTYGAEPTGSAPSAPTAQAPGPAASD